MKATQRSTMKAVRRLKASATHKGSAAIGIQNSGRAVKSSRLLARMIRRQHQDQQAELRAEELHPALPEAAQVGHEHLADDEVDDGVAEEPAAADGAADRLVGEGGAVIVVALVQQRAAGDDDARVLVGQVRAEELGALDDARAVRTRRVTGVGSPICGAQAGR